MPTRDEKWTFRVFDCHTIVIGSRLTAVVRSSEKGHNKNIVKYIEMGNGDVL